MWAGSSRAAAAAMKEQSSYPGNGGRGAAAAGERRCSPGVTHAAAVHGWTRIGYVRVSARRRATKPEKDSA